MLHALNREVRTAVGSSALARPAGPDHAPPVVKIKDLAPQPECLKWRIDLPEAISLGGGMREKRAYDDGVANGPNSTGRSPSRSA